MLQFNKNGIAFTVTSDGGLLVATKLIDNKGYRLIQQLDGTISSLGKAINKLCALELDDFKLYASIQESELKEDLDDN